MDDTKVKAAALECMQRLCPHVPKDLPPEKSMTQLAFIEGVAFGMKMRADASTEHIVTTDAEFEICTACSGSGYYDNDGSPPCGCCDGSGKVLVSDSKI